MEEHLKLGKAGVKEILYNESTGDIPRIVMFDFLKDATKIMTHESTVREIIDRSIATKLPLHEASVDFQRDLLEWNYQIERNFGCKSLSLIQNRFGDDNEMIEAAYGFMFACLRGYINQLKARSKLYKKGVVVAPNPNESMSRTTIMEFFEGCNALSKYISYSCVLT